MIAQRSGSSMAWRRKPSCTRRWKASPGGLEAVLGAVAAARSAASGLTSSSTTRSGQRPSVAQRGQLLDLGGGQLAAVALVGDRRAGEAVADHRAPGVERRLDHLGDVLGPVGRHEQRLGPRR